MKKMVTVILEEVRVNKRVCMMGKGTGNDKRTDREAERRNRERGLCGKQGIEREGRRGLGG